MVLDHAAAGAAARSRRSAAAADEARDRSCRAGAATIRRRRRRRDGRGTGRAPPLPPRRRTPQLKDCETMAKRASIGGIGPTSASAARRWCRWRWRCSALTAFSTFVMDYGVLWAAGGRRRTPPMPARWPARSPLAFDERPTPAGASRAGGQATAPRERGVGEPPSVLVADLTADRRGRRRARSPGASVRPVDVYRNGDARQSVPTSSARLFGVTSQGVQGDGDRAGHDRERDRLPPALGDSPTLDRGRDAPAGCTGTTDYPASPLAAPPRTITSRRMRSARDGLQVARCAAHSLVRRWRLTCDELRRTGSTVDPIVWFWAMRLDPAGRASRKRGLPATAMPIEVGDSVINRTWRDAGARLDGWTSTTWLLTWRRRLAARRPAAATGVRSLPPAAGRRRGFSTAVVRTCRSIDTGDATVARPERAPCTSARSSTSWVFIEGLMHRQRGWLERHADQLSGPVRPRGAEAVGPVVVSAGAHVLVR